MVVPIPLLWDRFALFVVNSANGNGTFHLCVGKNEAEPVVIRLPRHSSHPTSRSSSDAGRVSIGYRLDND